jgi:hypothetical protein
MIFEALLWVATSWVPFVASGGLGIVGVVGGWLGLFGKPWNFLAGIAGRLLLIVFVFLAGYRAADDHAAQKAKIERLETENKRLTDQLASQKLIAAFASQARDTLREQKAEADQKLAEYADWIKNNPPKAGTDACLIDDADLRFRRSLRPDRRR